MTPVAGCGWDRPDQSEPPASDALPEPAGMPPPSHMFSVPALCRSPKRLFEDPACWFAHLTTPNLLPRNQTTIDSLGNRLTDEVPLHRAGINQIEDRPQRPCNLEALHGLHVALGRSA